MCGLKKLFEPAMASLGQNVGLHHFDVMNTADESAKKGQDGQVAIMFIEPFIQQKTSGASICQQSGHSSLHTQVT